MRKYRSPAEVAQLMESAVAGREQGGTLKELAQSLGVSMPYLHTLLEKADRGKTAPPPVTRAEKYRDKIISMYQQTSEMPNAISLIAEALAITQDQIYNLLVTEGLIIPKRRQGEVARIESGIRMAKLYNEEGKTIPEIAQIMGVSVPYVYKTLRVNQVVLKARRQATIAAAVSLYNQGYNVAQIAEHLQMSTPNVYPLLAAAGITMREERAKKEQTEIDAIGDLYFGDHKTVAEIAALYSRRESTIWKIIQKAEAQRLPKERQPWEELEEMFPDTDKPTENQP